MSLTFSMLPQMGCKDILDTPAALDWKLCDGLYSQSTNVSKQSFIKHGIDSSFDFRQVAFTSCPNGFHLCITAHTALETMWATEKPWKLAPPALQTQALFLDLLHRLAAHVPHSTPQK